MAKQKGRVGPGRMAMPVLAQPPTGEAHPTPDTVPGMYVFNAHIPSLSGGVNYPIIQIPYFLVLKGSLSLLVNRGVVPFMETGFQNQMYYLSIF